MTKFQRPGYLYVICHQMDGGWAAPSKIGVSRNPWTRAAELQGGNPRSVGVYATIRLGFALAERVEQAILEVHADRRLTGEWLAFEPRELLQVALVATETGATVEGGIRADDARVAALAEMRLYEPTVSRGARA